MYRPANTPTIQQTLRLSNELPIVTFAASSRETTVAEWTDYDLVYDGRAVGEASVAEVADGVYTFENLEFYESHDKPAYRFAAHLTAIELAHREAAAFRTPPETILETDVTIWETLIAAGVAQKIREFVVTEPALETDEQEDLVHANETHRYDRYDLCEGHAVVPPVNPAEGSAEWLARYILADKHNPAKGWLSGPLGP